MRYARWLAAVLVAPGCAVLVGCGGSADAVAPSREAGATPPRPSQVDLQPVLAIDFEDAAVPLVEGTLVSPGVVHLAGSAPDPLRVVAGAKGSSVAVAFPGPCPASDPTCPKAIVEVADDAALKPGAADFGFGARVLLAPDQTSTGSNVIQKGFSRGGGSQWKLQIDGLDGRPSCVLVGLGDDTVHQARAEVTVADGTWHALACRRAGDALRLTVDGLEQATTTVPADLTVAPPGPVRIGGKSLKSDNDQYFGAMDDLFVSTVR